MGESEEISVKPLYLTNNKEEISLNGHVAIHKTRKVRDVGGYQNVGIPKGWSERITGFIENPVVDINLIWTEQKGWVILIEQQKRK